MERQGTTKATVTLAAVERAVVQKNAHLPPDAKRRMVHAEYKRLKHCETVRQSRVRKKAERLDLRKVNATLETELNEVVEKYRGKHDWMSFDEKSEHDVMFKKFLHSIYEVRALRRESTDLKEQLMVYDTLGEHFERLRMDYQIPPQLNNRLAMGTVHFEELSQDEAQQIMIDSHEQATSFFENMQKNVTGDEEKTMGWTQYQDITPNGSVVFNFTKRITTIGAEALVDRSWEMYNDFHLYHGIYASVQRLEFLQRINEDTVLIRRDLQEGSSAPVFRTIFLLFRIRLVNGYLICFRSHNPKIYADDDDEPNVQWMEMFYWLMITDPPQEDDGSRPVGCDVTFGGTVLNQCSAQHATRWKYQIAMALLRWESNAIAPFFPALISP